MPKYDLGYPPAHQYLTRVHTDLLGDGDIGGAWDEGAVALWTEILGGRKREDPHGLGDCRRAESRILGPEHHGNRGEGGGRTCKDNSILTIQFAVHGMG